MPDVPISSNGLRPKRSTQNTAMRVATTFTPPTAHSVARLWLVGSLKPAAAKMVSA